MSNETKRDVFDKLLNEYVDDERRIDGLVYEPDQHIGELDREYFATCYSAALPDDMPVLPELIGKYLKMWKHDHGDLFQAFDEGTSASLDGTKWESVQDWFGVAKDSFDTFACAWLDGVWRVKETGEIVKVEAEK
jgi:hypothetical protein